MEANCNSAREIIHAQAQSFSLCHGSRIMPNFLGRPLAEQPSGRTRAARFSCALGSSCCQLEVFEIVLLHVGFTSLQQAMVNQVRHAHVNLSDKVPTEDGRAQVLQRLPHIGRSEPSSSRGSVHQAVQK
jgi:hypothetical protein